MVYHRGVYDMYHRGFSILLKGGLHFLLGWGEDEVLGEYYWRGHSFCVVY